MKATPIQSQEHVVHGGNVGSKDQQCGTIRGEEPPSLHRMPPSTCQRLEIEQPRTHPSNFPVDRADPEVAGRPVDQDVPRIELTVYERARKRIESVGRLVVPLEHAEQSLRARVLGLAQAVASAFAPREVEILPILEEERGR